MRARTVLLLLLAAVSGSAIAADPLGRLFSTPEERARLDAIRNDPDFGKPPPVEQVVEVAPAPDSPAAPRVPEVEVSGVVMRADGRNTAWINGHEVAAGEPSPEGVRVYVRRDGDVRIELPEGDETVPLKPGQKIDVLSGAVADAWEQRAGADARSAFAPAVADDSAGWGAAGGVGDDPVPTSD